MEFKAKFNILLIDKTALYLAIEKDNVEISKLLLMNGKLDINFGYIFLNFYIKFKITSLHYIQSHFFNEIQNHIIQ